MNVRDDARLTVCCADVGSVEKGRFGWALRDLPAPLHEVPEKASIVEFADAVAERIEVERSVALCFEFLLFVPIRKEPDDLLRARKGKETARGPLARGPARS